MCHTQSLLIYDLSQNKRHFYMNTAMCGEETGGQPVNFSYYTTTSCTDTVYASSLVAVGYKNFFFFFV